MSNQIILRDYQEEAVKLTFDAFEKHNNVMLVLSTGAGKCMARDTPILMHNGSVKLVQDIAIGDSLMGPDSKPREVKSLARGREEMFRVTPKKGGEYTVNKSHILSLRMTGRDGVYCSRGIKHAGGDIVNISIEDYLASTKTFKHCAKGWRSSVEFETKEHSRYLPAYLLGVWLGDGTTAQPHITSGDIEIENYLSDFVDETDQRYAKLDINPGCTTYSICGKGTGGCKGKPTAFTRNEMNRLNLLGYKYIPDNYLHGDREQRLQLLAGIVDSDGHNSKGGCDIVLKSKPLMDGLIYLARSLGFACYMHPCRKTCTNNGVTGDYFRAYISGDLSIIPTLIPRNKFNPRKQKKNVLNVGIKLESIGQGDYYGFEIDGDHLYMLGDFTVTHNTVCFSYIAKQVNDAGESVTIIAHRAELISQASITMAMAGVDHQLIAPKPLIAKIKQTHYTKFGRCFIDPFANAYVGSVQTMARRLDSLKTTDWLIIDECAHATAKQYTDIIDLYQSKTLGVTAIPSRSDGLGLGRIFSKMVVGKSMKSLLADGNLCHYRVYSTPEDMDLGSVKKIKSGESKGDYNLNDLAEAVDKPKIVGRAVEHYEKYAKGTSCLVFAVSVAHSEHIAVEFRNAGYKFVSINGCTDASERHKAIEDLKLKKIHGIVNCSVLGEGTDITGVESLIMMRPISEHAFSLFGQQVGRALRLAKGKDEAIIIDMVSNFKTHGFPEDYTDWTLDDREKKKKTKEDEDTEKTKTCPDCFITSPNKKYCKHCRTDHSGDIGCSLDDPFINICPNCGYIHPVMDREYEQIEGELVELERQQEQEKARKDYNSELRQAETAAQLLALDKASGHQPGAAGHKQRAIEEKKAAAVKMQKSIKYFKENIAGGSPQVFADIMQSAFKTTEQEARKLSAAKIEKLLDTMREFLELRNAEAVQPYSSYNNRMYLFNQTMGF